MRINLQNTPVALAIIPRMIDQLFPFKAEPLVSFDENSDILEFCVRLFDGTGYAFYGETAFQQSYQELLRLSQFFNQIFLNQSDPPGAKPQRPETFDYAADPAFGTISKYAIAVDAVINSILSENLHASNPHMLEFQSDHKTALELVGLCRYKHAMMVLRSALETLVAPMYYMIKPDAFTQWTKNADTRLPSVRGKNGMLKLLQESGWLPKYLSQEIGRIYGELNAYIHGAEYTFIHRDLEKGKWEGRGFKPREYARFAVVLRKLSISAIKVFRIQISMREYQCRGKSL